MKKISIKKVKQTFKDMDKILLITTLALFIFGLLNIVTASSKAAVVRYNTSLYSYFWKQLSALLVGGFAFLMIIKTPTKKYAHLSTLVYAVILGLILYIFFYGTVHLGSKNWIRIPGFGTMQPSEFAKPAIIVVLAVMFEKFYKSLKNPNIKHWDLIGTILLAGCVIPAFVYLEGDLGTSIIIMVIFGLMFLFSPILKEEKVKIIGILSALFVVVVFYTVASTGSLLSGSQASRFNFFNPCSDYYEGGYQICNGFIAINDGGLLGLGIGNSKQVSYIPESHTDSVFAIISEEYGFVLCTFIFLAYLVVLLRIFRLSSNTSSIKGKYICYGIGVYLALHIIVNLGGLFGIMPLTGVPLPFLSYGGSFTLSLCCALGLVQRVHIEYEREKIKV